MRYPTMPRPARAGVLLGFLLLARGASAGTLDVPRLSQTGNYWCWSADAEMVLDYLSPSKLYQAAVGQCSFARSIPLPGCNCAPPDGLNSTDIDCDKPTPFGKADFLPGLLGRVIKTAQTAGLRRPLHRKILTCEIEERKRPLLAWWRNDDCDNGAGHIVVVSGVERDILDRDLVLIQDPSPTRMGDSYWLTWRGFACGPQLQGHCVDYFDIQGTAAPAMCSADSQLDDLDCKKTAPTSSEKIDSVSAATSAVNELLASDAGPRLLHGLGGPRSVRRITCNERLFVHGARIVFRTGGSLALANTGTTRLLCELQAEVSRSPASIFLIDQRQGWLLAGFGASRTTQWLQQSADPLVEALKRKAGSKPIERIDLYAVEIPGTGDLLLILPDPQTGDVALHLQAPYELGPRPLRAVLQDPVSGPGSPTLEAWLRQPPPEEREVP